MITLTEGAGAGYDVELSGEIKTINSYKFESIKKADNGYDVTFTCDIDGTVDIDDYSSYMYGRNEYDEQFRDVPCKITRVKLWIWHGYGTEDEIKNDSIRDFEADITDLFADKDTYRFGSGWIHQIFDGTLDNGTIELHLTDNFVIDEIEYICSGERDEDMENLDDEVDAEFESNIDDYVDL